MTRRLDWTHDYVALLPCGCCCGLAADLGNRDPARQVAEWIRQGYTVERHSMDEIRATHRYDPMGCVCRPVLEVAP